MGIKKYMHGGNHLEGTNYNLSGNRYNTKAQKYRRFKKGGQVLDVYSSKGEVKGKGVNGRELYNGPYKDMTINNFFDFPNGVFKTNSEGISFANDPEYKNWRSKKRGYSADELLKYYIHTQIYIDGANVNPMDRSTWEGKNFGSARRYEVDNNTGEIVYKNNGQPSFLGHNEELHQTYLNRKNAGDPKASWYPSSQNEAFGMAKDLGLGVFFYEGKPVLVQTEEEQIESKKETGEWWKTNISPQLDKKLQFADDDSKIDFSELTRESMIFLNYNPEVANKLSPRLTQDFKSQKDALEFFNQTKNIGFFGSGVTVNGKPVLMHDYKSDPNFTGTGNDDISSMIYDANLTGAVMQARDEYNLTFGRPRMDIDNTRIDGFSEPAQMTFEEYWLTWQQQNKYSPKYESISNAKDSELQKIFELQGGQAFYGSSSNPMPARRYNGQGGARSFTIGDRKVSNPLHSYDGTAPTMGTLMGDLAFLGAGLGSLAWKQGFKVTAGYWTNPGKYGLFGSAGNTLIQPLKYGQKLYDKSALNKYVMEPTLSGTAGLGNLNTAANLTFAGIAGDQAITDFSEGNYGSGALNLGFAGLNAFNPYRKFQNNAKLFNTKNIKPFVPVNYDLKGLESFVNNKLPAVSLRQGFNNTTNTNYFMPKATQLGAQKYLNNAIKSQGVTPNNSAYGKFVLQ